ncbi:DUF5076 domain-containing protein [Pandoraea sp. ISTKB]|uniref:DUF5076 domain-containing protein n=1 Tax=Pandoraea sp. ISTKB TaxID=1586708 RepID=UPI000846F0E4|nr:DUF5076 domain-containing protein [Pandoraea sp. ISTKB]ODP31046.1 hypothetical protein A9762_08380 [Pandoraea sp. ISTKB]
MHACPIPDAVLADNDAVEMLRVWTAEKAMYCSMKVGMYQETRQISEEAVWGVILADVARQVSDALQRASPGTQADSLAMVRDHFLNELRAPSVQSTEDAPQQRH